MDDNWDEETYTLKQYRDRQTKVVLREIYFNAVGQKDRGGLPSLIEYNENGVPYEFRYYKDDGCHRIDGPAAYTVNPENGIVTLEAWYINDGLHRSRGLPALIGRDSETGEVNYRVFFENNKKIRPDIEGIKNNKQFENENILSVSEP